MSEYIEWIYDDLPECIKDMPRALRSLECIDPSDARDTWQRNCEGVGTGLHYRMLRWKYEQAYQYFDKESGYIVWPMGTLPEQFRDSEHIISGLEGKCVGDAWSSGMMGSSYAIIHYRMRPEDFERLAVEPVAKPALQQEKPPLGIKPQSIWIASRVDEILQAMLRYRRSQRQIPEEWIVELDSHVQELQRIGMLDD